MLFTSDLVKRIRCLNSDSGRREGVALEAAPRSGSQLRAAWARLPHHPIGGLRPALRTGHKALSGVPV